MPGRALYPEFLPEGTSLRSVKSGKALYPGSGLSRKTYIALVGFAQGTEEKRVLKTGKRYIRGALYPSYTVYRNLRYGRNQ